MANALPLARVKATHRSPVAASRKAASRRAAAPALAPKPFIKWAGGKTRLMPQLMPLMPPANELMRHVEPFVGGGAMFFHRMPERSFLADVNPALVNVYQAVRDDVEGVISDLEVLSRDVSKEAFYGVRERYNAHKAKPRTQAAMFIYLNKTCFNGLHRVNRKGQFNVPYGKYKNPRVVNPEVLRAASATLQGAEIHCQGFERLLSHARPGDFVYFDPPYEPVSATASFTSYAKNGFGQNDQRMLRDVFRELDRRGCKVMLSNSDVPFIRDLYKEWNIDIVAAPRAISCNARGRKKVAEVVVRNYG